MLILARAAIVCCSLLALLLIQTISGLAPVLRRAATMCGPRKLVVLTTAVFLWTAGEATVS